MKARRRVGLKRGRDYSLLFFGRNYSVRRESTGSFLLAERDGINPPMMVRIIERMMRRMALFGLR